MKTQLLILILTLVCLCSCDSQPVYRIDVTEPGALIMGQWSTNRYCKSDLSIEWTGSSTPHYLLLGINGTEDVPGTESGSAIGHKGGNPTKTDDLGMQGPPVNAASVSQIETTINAFYVNFTGSSYVIHLDIYTGPTFLGRVTYDLVAETLGLDYETIGPKTLAVSVNRAQAADLHVKIIGVQDGATLGDIQTVAWLRFRYMYQPIRRRNNFNFETFN